MMPYSKSHISKLLLFVLNTNHLFFIKSFINTTEICKVIVSVKQNTDIYKFCFQ